MISDNFSVPDILTAKPLQVGDIRTEVNLKIKAYYAQIKNKRLLL